MPPRVRWIQHQGQSILCSNHASLGEAEYLQAMDETKRELLSRQAGNRVLTVTDVSHSHPSRTILAKANEMAAAAKAAGITTVDSVVDIGRLQRPIAPKQNVTGLCTAGDAQVLPRVLRACQQFSPMSQAEQEALIATAGQFEPLFA